MLIKVHSSHRSSLRAFPSGKAHTESSILIVICKGTRFFDTCNPSPPFFSSFIRFLINRIGYRLQNIGFLPRRPARPRSNAPKASRPPIYNNVRAYINNICLSIFILTLCILKSVRIDFSGPRDSSLAKTRKNFSNPLAHKQVSKIGLLFERQQEAATPTFPPESYVFLRRKHLFPSRESIFSSERKRNPFREYLAARLLTAHDPAATPSRWVFSPHINAHP